MIDRLKREKDFHNKRFDDNSILRNHANKYYAVNKHVEDRYVDIVAKHCKEKKVLEYGCGSGSQSLQWLELDAKLIGIDISSKGIEKAKEKISKTNYNAEYYIMDAEKTKFNDNVFDLVIGTGIIHHLNILNSYKEISRILNDDGHAIFIEPLGHNPLINLYRKLTPEMRTKDEHPLKINDIKLMEQYFHDVHIEYYSLFVLFAVPIRKLWFFKKIYNILKIVDEIVLRFPFIRRYAWTILVHAHRPKIN